MLAKVDHRRTAPGRILVRRCMGVPRMTISAPFIITVLARIWHATVDPGPSMRTTGSAVAEDRSRMCTSRMRRFSSLAICLVADFGAAQAGLVVAQLEWQDHRCCARIRDDRRARRGRELEI